MVIRQLICNAVEYSENENSICLHSKCPACGFDWQENISLNEGGSDFNREITYQISQHTNTKHQEGCVFSGESVKVFLAVHRDGDGSKVCVQRSDAEGAEGIPNEWWVTPT
jgi:hypothetical protein